jgi:hypothetical protein
LEKALINESSFKVKLLYNLKKCCFCCDVENVVFKWTIVKFASEYLTPYNLLTDENIINDFIILFTKISLSYKTTNITVISEIF